MSDWTDGYFTSSTYTYGYYNELSPTYQKFCLLANGLDSPEIDENTAYCELGYGQGVSINIHAASTVGKYFGTDFNPTHASHANELCNASGCGAKFFDDSFEQMLNRDDLPQFDFISLHGIWSWISTENQKHIVEFARRFLKPGGVFYNSYNCFPGWAPNSPMRELLILHDKFAENESNTYKRVEDALNFVDRLIKANPAYVQRVPSFAATFENARKHNHDYLAHEYLNRDWICMYFTDVLEFLSDAKLEFGCAATLSDVFDNLNLPKEAVDFLNSIQNPIIREQSKDYFVNRQFRKDIFVRGARKLNAFERRERIFDTPFVLTTVGDVSASFQTMRGNATMNEPVLNRVVEYLREHDYAPKRFADFAKNNRDINPIMLVEMLIILVDRKIISPCQSENFAKQVKPHCDALNLHLYERAKFSNNISFLASPLTGAGVQLGRFDQLFLQLSKRGKKSAEEVAKMVWDIISAQGQVLMKEGKKLDTAEGNIAEIKNMAQNFLDKQLPILKALQIA